MLKKITVLSFALMVSACAALQSAVQDNVQKPEVTYKTVSMGDVTGEKIELKPTFSIANKNGYAIPVDSITYDVAFNNVTMFNGKSDQVGTLPANASKDVTLGIDLTQDTLKSVKDVLMEDGKIDYVIKGEVEVMGLKFPFEQASSFYKPTVSMGGVDVESASFKQVDMVANLIVTNENDFTLPLDMLAYSVSSGKNQLVSGDLKNQVIKQGVNELKIPLSIDPSTMFSSLFSLLQEPNLPLSFNFSSGIFETSSEQSINLRSLLGY